MNFSDPFGLCTIKDWTACKLLSFTAGFGLGIGFSGSLGPVSVEGKAGKAGVEGSLSLGADGKTHVHGAATAAAFSGSVRALSHKFEAEAGSCSTEGGCKPGSVTIHGVEAASDGDISAKLQLGIELGATIHAGETATALIGAANFAWDLFKAEALKRIPTSIAP